MKHSKLLLAAALSAAAWCTASQAQTILYGTEYYSSSTGTTPSESSWVVYPESTYYGYTTESRRDYNGNWRQRNDYAGNGSLRRYVYPETTVIYPQNTQMMYPSYGVIYTTPFDSTITPRY